MAQVPYTKDELSILRRLHGMLETDPMGSPEAFLDVSRSLMSYAHVPNDVLLPRVEEWTKLLPKEPTSDDFKRVNDKILEFIEAIVDEYDSEEEPD